MRALVVYCHPREGSFNAAVRDTVVERLEAAGAEWRVIDLYREGFDPRLTGDALSAYEDPARNTRGIEAHAGAVCWCDTLIFVYPTWWYGLPAMLKGWLDRVLVPGVAFELPQVAGEGIRPCLGNVTAIAVFTTCGASRWLTALVGAPGRRTLLRGVRMLCPRACRTFFAAHYRMDHSTDATRAAHLRRVGAAMDRLTGGARPERRAVTA